MTADPIDQLDQDLLDRAALIGNQPGFGPPRAAQRAGKPLLQGRDALILVDPLRRAVADRQQTDQQLIITAHPAPPGCLPARSGRVP